MTTTGSGSHDQLVSLLWELKAAWQARGGGEVLLTNLMLEKAQLDRFLAEAGAVDDPQIRAIVAKILATRAELGTDPAPASQAPPRRPGSTPTSPTQSAASAKTSGFDAIRGGAVLIASLLVSAAAFRYLWMESPVNEVAAPAGVSRTAPAPPPEPAVTAAAVLAAPVAAPAAPKAAEPSVATPPAPKLTLAQSDVVLRVHGSNTVGEKLSPSLVESFLRGRGATTITTVPGSAPVEKSLIAAMPGLSRPIAIEIHAHGSSTAFTDLAGATTDLGQSSRRIKAEEVVKLGEKYGDLSKPGAEHVVALDGLAIIVHPQNAVKQLSVDQVAKIFAGSIKDWSEVGGAKGPIALYARDEVSGTWDTFKSLVLAPSKLELDAAARRFESSTELSDAVAGDGRAIGFIGLPYVRRSKLLAVSAETGGFALLPTAFTVATEDYPLSRRLYFYAPATSSNELMREFVDFTLSDRGQEVVQQVGFVSQNVALERPRIVADVPAEYRQTVEKAERLSLNFRFEAGSDELDAKGIRDLDRVVAFLSRSAGREILLLGFTDDRGEPRANTTLSRKRAEVVATALETRGVFSRNVFGFGEALPVASNSSEEGRNRNRRVEVWVN